MLLCLLVDHILIFEKAIAHFLLNYFGQSHISLFQKYTHKVDQASYIFITQQ